MDHVVFHPGPDGAPAFHRFASLDEAVRFVEHLRNVEGIDDVSVNLLTPVPLAFRAYYKVEVPAVEAPAVPEQAVVTEPVVEPVMPEPVDAAPVGLEPELVPVEPVPVDAAANGKRSLGFFSH